MAVAQISQVTAVIILRRASGLSFEEAISFIAAVLTPRPANCCTDDVAETRREEIPMPSGPRNMATNFPRRIFTRIVNT